VPPCFSRGVPLGGAKLIITPIASPGCPDVSRWIAPFKSREYPTALMKPSGKGRVAKLGVPDRKKRKAQPRRALRDLDVGCFPRSIFGLTRADLVDAPRSRATIPRIWGRSIGRRRKVVKGKQQANHKIFGPDCRKCLWVVVRSQNATSRFSLLTSSLGLSLLEQQRRSTSICAENFPSGTSELRRSDFAARFECFAFLQRS
jgi:hypothetical protein